MKEKRQSIRFSKDVHQLITERAQKDDVSFTEALERSVRENDRLHIYIRYLGSMQETTKEAPVCRRRLLINGEYVCVQTNKKGLQKLKPLPLLDICRVCRLERYKVPEHTEVKQKQQPRSYQEKDWRDPFDSQPVQSSHKQRDRGLDETDLFSLGQE